MTDGWVRSNGIRLHFIEWAPGGDGADPTLILLHGTSSNALYWARVMANLPGRHAIAFDLRGHGRSDRPDRGHSAEIMAVDVGGAIEALGLRRTVVIGHSWGMAVALTLASSRADIVSGVALLDGPFRLLSECVSWELAEHEMRTPSPVFGNLGEAERAQAAFLRGAWEEDLRDFVHASFRPLDGGWIPVLSEYARLEMLMCLYTFDPTEMLTSLPGPTLLGRATDASDGVAPDVLACWRGRAESVARRCRQATLREYDSGHDVPLIDPAAVAADLEDLWAATALGREAQSR